MNTRAIALACSLVLLSAVSVHAKLYKWVDSAGNVHFADDEAKVPDGASEIVPNDDRINIGPHSGGTQPPSREDLPDQQGNSADLQWQKRAEDLREKIRRGESDLAYYNRLRRDCRESQKNIISPRNRDCDNIYSFQVTKIQEGLEENRKKLDVDLPEEARRAGVAPGVLRESNAAGREQTQNAGRSEDWWRDRAGKLRAKLQAAQADLDKYTAEEQKCEEEQRYNTGCKRKNCKVMYESRVQGSKRKVEQLRQSLEVDLPEEARRAGAYPGWLRE